MNAFLDPLAVALFVRNTVEPGYNNIGLYDTSPVASDIT
jgi:hypothetical protein